MPMRPAFARLLAGRIEREHQAMRLADEAAREAVRHARELRDENAARLKLTEGRNRIGGWTN